MRPYPWKCPSCREKVVYPITEDYVAEMEHDGRAYSVHVDGLEILRCVACNHKQLPDESYARLNDELRRLAGLLTPPQIAEKRRALGLTQKELARLLEVAPETVSRWEGGGQIQQRVMNNFMNAFFEVPQLREYLKRLRCDSAVEAPRFERSSATVSMPQKMQPLAGENAFFSPSQPATKSGRQLVAAEG